MSRRSLLVRNSASLRPGWQGLTSSKKKSIYSAYLTGLGKGRVRAPTRIEDSVSWTGRGAGLDILVWYARAVEIGELASRLDLVGIPSWSLIGARFALKASRGVSNAVSPGRCNS